MVDRRDLEWFLLIVVWFPLSRPDRSLFPVKEISGSADPR